MCHGRFLAHVQMQSALMTASTKFRAWVVLYKKICIPRAYMRRQGSYELDNINYKKKERKKENK